MKLESQTAQKVLYPEHMYTSILHNEHVVVKSTDVARGTELLRHSSSGQKRSTSTSKHNIR